MEKAVIIRRKRSMVWLLSFTLLCGGVLGGGPTSPSVSMVVELTACLLLGVSSAGLIDSKIPGIAIAPLFLLALIAALPVMQLLPIPWNQWALLPGHQLPAAIIHVAGLGTNARPMSLSPHLTELSALSLLVPIAIFTATLQIDYNDRKIVILVVLAYCVLSATLGMLQFASNGGFTIPIYHQIHDGYAIGLFANRNHEADLLLIAVPFTAYIINLQRLRHNTKTWVLLGVVSFFVVSIISTKSRTGLSLLPVALSGAVVIWGVSLDSRRIWLRLILPATIAVAASSLLLMTPVGGQLIARFNGVSDDLRFSIWQGTWRGIKVFWPDGSGLGSFVPVFQMSEDLNAVTASYVNHAHNDYLELLLETGAFGLCLALFYFFTLAFILWRKASLSVRNQKYAAATAIMILLLHSLTDYPLRTSGLLAFFAFAHGLLYPPSDMHRVGADESKAA